VGTAPPSSIGASTFVLISAVKPKIASHPGKIAIREKVPVEGTLIQAAATSWSMPSCFLAEIVIESGSSSGPKDVHQDGVTLATGQTGDDDAAAPTLPDCASTDPSCSLSASTLDLTEVGATDLSVLLSSVLGVVIKRDAADGNPHALAQCAGTAPPSGIGASTVGLISVVVPKMASNPGKMMIGQDSAVELSLIQVASTSLSMPSCFLAEILQESASYSGAKDVQRDVATYATGQKCDEDAVAATLPDCEITARSCMLVPSTLDSTKVGATDLSALLSSVVGFLTERDTANGNAHAFAYFVGTAPPSSIGASTFVLVSAEKPKLSLIRVRLRFGKKFPWKGR
jgi:hypothetical protein